jgi:hypothetical protein
MPAADRKPSRVSRSCSALQQGPCSHCDRLQSGRQTVPDGVGSSGASIRLRVDVRNEMWFAPRADLLESRLSAGRLAARSRHPWRPAFASARVTQTGSRRGCSGCPACASRIRFGSPSTPVAAAFSCGVSARGRPASAPFGAGSRSGGGSTRNVVKQLRPRRCAFACATGPASPNFLTCRRVDTERTACVPRALSCNAESGRTGVIRDASQKLPLARGKWRGWRSRAGRAAMNTAVLRDDASGRVTPCRRSRCSAGRSARSLRSGRRRRRLRDPTLSPPCEPRVGWPVERFDRIGRPRSPVPSPPG